MMHMQDIISLGISILDFFYFIFNPTSVQHHLGLKGGISLGASLPGTGSPSRPLF